MKTIAILLCFSFMTCAACARSGQPHVQEAPKNLFQRLPENRGGIFKEGDWTYVLNIRNPGSRSEGAEGRLYYRGKEVEPPGDSRDYYDTPLGIFRHTGIEVGNERYPWDATGWMQQSEPAVTVGGNALPWPRGRGD